MNASTRIMIVEDEAGIAVALYTALIKAGYIVDTAKTGSSALRKANNKNYDIVLLDLGLPDMSGLTICKQLRADGLEAPIIILTAENTISTKVKLFDAGANDFVTKPFSLEELQARIRACLRANAKEDRQEMIVAGALQLNPATRSIERGGIIIPLTRKEYVVMQYLMEHAGKAVTRASLLQHAWNGSDDAWTNTVDVHIKHLRDKIDRPFPTPLIQTVHGVGYKLLVPNLVANT